MAFPKPPIDTETNDWIWKRWFMLLYNEVLALISATISDGDKGDITVSTSGTVWTIDNDAVNNDKLANMATQTFKGRTTAGTGNPEDLTVAQAKTMLNLAGSNSGDQTITLTGDVTGNGTGTFGVTIVTDTVDNTKLANMATQTIKGRTTAGTGDPEDLSATQALAVITPLTTKGDILARDGSASVRHAAGTNYAVLEADSTATNGIAWRVEPKFFAYRSANESLASGAWTKISFDGEIFDTNSNYDPTTNFRFTPTIAGYYMLRTIARWGFAPGVGGLTLGLRFYLNGSTEIARDIVYPINGYACNQMVVNTLRYFNGSTDYVEVQAYQDSGSNQNIVGGTADCQFSGERVGG